MHVYRLTLFLIVFGLKLLKFLQILSDSDLFNNLKFLKIQGSNLTVIFKTNVSFSGKELAGISY